MFFFLDLIEHKNVTIKKLIFAVVATLVGSKPCYRSGTIRGKLSDGLQPVFIPNFEHKITLVAVYIL